MQDIRQIIVPVDFHSNTDKLAEFAVGMANKLSAKVTFLHLIGEISYHSEIRPESVKLLDEEFRSHAQKMMSALLEKNKSACPGCTGRVEMGDAAEGVVTYAKDQNADLIIIGTHGARGIKKILLGSVAERVLKSAHCPTLIFNPYKGERG